MGVLVVGVEDGRSCVVSERDISPVELVPGLSLDALYRTTESPPPPRPPGRGEPVDLGISPGQLSWALWRFEPHAEVGRHHTDTVDVDVIIEGSVALVLDDGAHLLVPGDCVVVPGVDHAWQAGAEGCLISAVALGSRLAP